MADLIATPRAESHTLAEQERALRDYLKDSLGIDARDAVLSDVRAMLVSGSTAVGPKGIVMDSSLPAAERIYLYLHLAAHVALGHNVPVVTIVEARSGSADRQLHEDAERLARAMWWGLAGEGGLGAILPSRRSRLLRRALRTGLARVALRGALIAMRQAYYRLHLSTALAGSPLTRALRRALCVTAVVCAAPQLVEEESPMRSRPDSNRRSRP